MITGGKRLTTNLAPGLELTLVLLRTLGAGSVVVANSNVSIFIENNQTCAGGCSLQEAVIAAHTAPDASTIILLAATYSLTRV